MARLNWVHELDKSVCRCLFKDVGRCVAFEALGREFVSRAERNSHIKSESEVEIEYPITTRYRRLTVAVTKIL